jgi:hypothetical protein
MSDWRVWALGLFAGLADATGLTGDARLARGSLDEMYRLADESGSAVAKVRWHQAAAIVALLDGQPDRAVLDLTHGLDLARTQRAGLAEEASMLVHLARAHLEAGEDAAARATADEAVATATRQGALVVACMGQVVRARVLRVTDPNDAAQARAVLDAGDALAESLAAHTWAAFLAEERFRLDGGDLAAIAAGYARTGATGHAERLRAEVAAT